MPTTSLPLSGSSRLEESSNLCGGCCDSFGHVLLLLIVVVVDCMLNALVCVLPRLALLLLQIFGKLSEITIQPSGIKANCLHSLRNGAFTARDVVGLEEIFHFTCTLL